MTTRWAAGLGAAALLRSSFAAKAGSPRFYLLTTALAGIWTGGALSGGPIQWRGKTSTGTALIVVPALTGAATFAGAFFPPGKLLSGTVIGSSIASISLRHSSNHGGSSI